MRRVFGMTAGNFPQKTTKKAIHTQQITKQAITFFFRFDGIPAGCARNWKTYRLYDTQMNSKYSARKRIGIEITTRYSVMMWNRMKGKKPLKNSISLQIVWHSNNRFDEIISLKFNRAAKHWKRQKYSAKYSLSILRTELNRTT